MNTRSLKISWIILVVAGAAIIVSGLLMVLSPEFFLVNEFNGYTGQEWTDFGEVNPAPLSFFLLEATQMGFFMITMGIMVITITYFAYRTCQKWSWYLLLVTVTLGAGSSMLTNLPTKDVVSVTLVGIILIASYIALALGAKPILVSMPKETREGFAG